MVSMSLVYYYEGREFPVSDTHPLRYKFHGIAPYHLKSIEGLEDYIQLACSSTLLKLQSIRNQGLFFDERQTIAEDAFFINVFLINNLKSKALFVRDSVYFYRKREDKSSALDKCWGKKDKILSPLYLFHQRLVKYSKEHISYVPQFVQNTIF